MEKDTGLYFAQKEMRFKTDEEKELVNNEVNLMREIFEIFRK